MRLRSAGRPVCRTPGHRAPPGSHPLDATLLRPLDRDGLRRQFSEARPFPFVQVDGFLDPAFAEEVAAACPSFEEAGRIGHEFRRVNENRKVQITDPERFPEPFRRLHEALSAPAFLQELEAITGIRNLLADPLLRGGGIHVTGPSGRLDVHADFNLIRDRMLYRRLNLLLYLNAGWQRAWGGAVELWDRDVKRCHHSIGPVLNRCVLFATSDISFHGVTQVTCPPGQARRSFAAYYYTREAPSGWEGRSHSTIFKPRPDEHLRRYLLMPAERLQRRVATGIDAVRRRLRLLLNRAS